jgi:hypothetical protein
MLGNMHVALIHVRKNAHSANNGNVYDKVITRYFHSLPVIRITQLLKNMDIMEGLGPN